MSLLIDLKYTSLISNRFEKFAKKDTYLFNCRCPICGDSKKNKSKMRGYIYRKGNDLFYRCHNCGAGLTLGNLIKHLSPELFKEYTLERYKSGEGSKNSVANTVINISPPKFDKVEKMKTFEHAEWCDKLPEEHFCIQYLNNRKIPKKFWNKLLFTKNYKAFIDNLIPNHDKNLIEDARLVIPFYDEYDDLIAVTGRALETSDKTLRYITLRTNESDKKLIYGMDRLDISKPVRIVEGQFDSMFLDNAVASCDANLLHTAKELIKRGFLKENIILCPDREPRNREIVKIINKFIDDDFNVCLLPNILEGKDINEHILNGVSSENLEKIISENTFKGIKLRMEFTQWKKI